MPHFHYRAARPDGSIIENTTEGDSEHSIRTNLEAQGLLILELGIPKGAGSLFSPASTNAKTPLTSGILGVQSRISRPD